MSSALSVAPLLPHETRVSPTRTRRQFTATYTLQILTAADACTKPGACGAHHRRPKTFSQLVGLTLPPLDEPTESRS